MILRLLAPLSFAALLAMAVATVAIKTSSLRARARIEGLVLEIKAKGFELAHRQRALQQATTPAALSARLQAVLVGTGPE